ncbi:hypothetical protein [Hydrocoleum sp. CS-953]|nr:hypothetical protein [Hydrocoleum sp. CS-953]
MKEKVWKDLSSNPKSKKMKLLKPYIVKVLAKTNRKIQKKIREMLDK